MWILQHLYPWLAVSGVLYYRGVRCGCCCGELDSGGSDICQCLGWSVVVKQV